MEQVSTEGVLLRYVFFVFQEFVHGVDVLFVFLLIVSDMNGSWKFLFGLGVQLLVLQSRPVESKFPIRSSLNGEFYRPQMFILVRSDS